MPSSVYSASQKYNYVTLTTTTRPGLLARQLAIYTGHVTCFSRLITSQTNTHINIPSQFINLVPYYKVTL